MDGIAWSLRDGILILILYIGYDSRDSSPHAGADIFGYKVDHDTHLLWSMRI